MMADSLDFEPTDDVYMTYAREDDGQGATTAPASR